MKTYTYSEARQRLATLLDQARADGQVKIVRQDGSTFVLQPDIPTTSPLDVPAVRGRLRTGELVAIVRDERRRAGKALAAALTTGLTRRSEKSRSAVRGTPARKK